jgi:tRNA (guanine37-N1)-methyltransferase
VSVSGQESAQALRHYEAITLFPEMFSALTGFGITGRARERGLYRLGVWNPRDYTSDPHRRVDDRPYGGGPGMVMRVEPLKATLDAIRATWHCQGQRPGRVVALSPQGRRLDQAHVLALAKEPALVFLCGRYEGIDQRFLDRHVDDEISVGDFVVSGGELPAMLLMDALIRQLPGALNDMESAVQDSFVTGLLDCPHYTRPEVYEGQSVPPVLLSGDHERIRRFRLEQALHQTWKRRPDLLKERALNPEEERLLDPLLQAQSGLEASNP